MEFVWWGIFAICFVFGFLGCFINKIPGPIAVVIATIVAMAALDIEVEGLTVGIIVALAIGSMIASKILVKMVKKAQTFTKRGSWGTTIGSIVGLCVLAKCSGDSVFLAIVMGIVGLVVIPFIFAFLLELTHKLGTPVAVKYATAATSAYLADTFLKLIVFAYATYVLFLN